MIWLLGGVTVLLYGAFPKAAVASWGVAGICLALGWLGPAVNMPQAVMDISPFTHLPKLPGGTGMEWGPVLALTAVAVVLVGAGAVALRRRDVQT